MLCLKECTEGSVVKILKVEAKETLKKRLMELGFLPGRHLKVIRNAPLKDPIEIEIMGYLLAIRKSEAEYILVEKIKGR